MLVTVLEAVEMLRAKLSGEEVAVPVAEAEARTEAEEMVEWAESTPPEAEVAAAMAAVAAEGGRGLAAPYIKEMPAFICCSRQKHQ